MKTGISAATLALLLGAPAFADTVLATTTQDMALRSGPGAQYDVVTAVPKDSNVDVIGCLAEADWCNVDFAGNEGWIYNAYLSGVRDQEVVSIYRNVAGMDIAIIEAEGLDETQASMVPAGVLELPDAETVEVVEIDEAVRAYVESNPVESVLLDGEVVLGAGVPDSVTIYEVPEAGVSYVTINGTPVVVNPETRRVVYIIG